MVCFFHHQDFRGLFQLRLSATSVLHKECHHLCSNTPEREPLPSGAPRLRCPKKLSATLTLLLEQTLKVLTYLKNLTAWCRDKHHMSINTTALSCVAPSHHCHQFRVTHLELVLSFHSRRKKTVCRAAVMSSDPSVVCRANNLREPASESLFAFPHISANFKAESFSHICYGRKHHLGHTDAHIHLVESPKWQRSLPCSQRISAPFPGKTKELLPLPALALQLRATHFIWRWQLQDTSCLW